VTVDISPLAGFADRFAEASERGAPNLQILEKPLWHQLNLRVARDACALLTSELGLAAAPEPNTVSSGGRRQLLWLGPDEWLLLTPDDIDGLDARLRAAAGDTPISVVDVSAARTIISLSGPTARLVLAHGCGLDLDAAHFAAGTCAQTKLALANIILLAPQDQPNDFGTSPLFLILVRSSFARYLASWLLDAATEYTGT